MNIAKEDFNRIIEFFTNIQDCHSIICSDCIDELKYIEFKLKEKYVNRKAKKKITTRKSQSNR